MEWCCTNVFVNYKLEKMRNFKKFAAATPWRAFFFLLDEPDLGSTDAKITPNPQKEKTNARPLRRQRADTELRIGRRPRGILCVAVAPWEDLGEGAWAPLLVSILQGIGMEPWFILFTICKCLARSLCWVPPISTNVIFDSGPAFDPFNLNDNCWWVYWNEKDRQSRSFPFITFTKRFLCGSTKANIPSWTSSPLSS